MKFTPPPSFFQPDFLELFKTFKTDYISSTICLIPKLKNCIIVQKSVILNTGICRGLCNGAVISKK